MKAAAIRKKKVLQVLQWIRKSDLQDKTQIADAILKRLDLIRREHTENLLCNKHAQQLRGYRKHQTLPRMAKRGNLHLYKVCCKEFYSRQEIAEMPPKRAPRTGHPKVLKVGLSQRWNK